MQSSEIIAIQNYLRKLFGGDRIRLIGGKGDQPVEVYVGDEFVGTVYRVEEEGEVSYSFTMSILDIDLAPVG